MLRRAIGRRGETGCEKGQVALEYLGLIVLVGAIIAALLLGALPLGRRISGGLQYAICMIVSREAKCRHPGDEKPTVVAEPPDYYFCPMYERHREINFNAVVYYGRIDVGGGDAIVNYIDPTTGERFSLVTLSAEAGGGVEGEWGSKASVEGELVATAGVDKIFMFDGDIDNDGDQDMKPQQAAEKFLRDRRGSAFKRHLMAVTGPLGSAVETGWNVLFEGDDPLEDKQPFGYAARVDLQGLLSMSAQLDGTAVDVGAGGEAEFKLTGYYEYRPGRRRSNRIFRLRAEGEATVEVNAVIGVDDLTKSRSKVDTLVQFFTLEAGASAGVGGGFTYEVRFNKQGEPQYFEIRTTWKTHAGIQVKFGGEGNAGKDKLDGKNKQRSARQHVHVWGINLQEHPEALRAFKKAFYAHGGVAVPKLLVGGVVNREATRKFMKFWQQVQNHGAEVSAVNRVTDSEMSAKGQQEGRDWSKGGFGVGYSNTKETTEFLHGKFIDHDVPNAQWQPLAKCDGGKE